ncbi:MAG: DNA gyrase inhibitor YacG [Alphaproteobacteria bacterium]|nr:DNA gyrase inhibitor YacG [Alphaproteobacteria bacterium]
MAKKPNVSVEKNRPDGVRVTAAKCVRCKQPVVARFRPFCSQRCSDLDLAGWLTSQYRIPTDETPDGYETEPPADED